MKTKLIDRAERLTVIERLLFESQSGLRVVELARSCGVDRRTIYRDLEVLTDLGLPINHRNGRFFIDLENYLLTVRLTLHEAVALFAAVRTAAYYAQLQTPHLSAALRKISHTLPSLPAQHIARVADMVQLSEEERAYTHILETVIRGWAECRLLEIVIGTETASREFAPYVVESSPKGGFFALGYDLTTKTFRTLSIRRIIRARLLRTVFEMPVHFNPRPYLASVSMMPAEERDHE